MTALLKLKSVHCEHEEDCFHTQVLAEVVNGRMLAGATQGRKEKRWTLGSSSPRPRRNGLPVRQILLVLDHE
jgi:hypothetical protein